MDFRIITRAEWGARHENGWGPRSLGHLDKWLHHSVTQAPDLIPPFNDDFAAIRELEAIGESRFGRGISYTFPITPAGLIFEGHSVDRVGSHTGGRNSTSAGIVLVGNSMGQPPTTQQEQAIAWLLNHGVAQRWWRLNTLTGGHRNTKATACPGDQAYERISYINWLASNPGGVIPVSNPVVEPEPAPPVQQPQTPAAPPFPLPAGHYFGWKAGPKESVSGYFSHRGDLGHWQQRMKARGWVIEPDGLYGPQTNKVTVQFQREKGLKVDGRIGPATWAAAWTAPIT